MFSKNCRRQKPKLSKWKRNVSDAIFQYSEERTRASKSLFYKHIVYFWLSLIMLKIFFFQPQNICGILTNFIIKQKTWFCFIFHCFCKLKCPFLRFRLHVLVMSGMIKIEAQAQVMLALCLIFEDFSA